MQFSEKKVDERTSRYHGGARVSDEPHVAIGLIFTRRGNEENA